MSLVSKEHDRDLCMQMYELWKTRRQTHLNEMLGSKEIWWWFMSKQSHWYLGIRSLQLFSVLWWFFLALYTMWCQCEVINLWRTVVFAVFSSDANEMYNFINRKRAHFSEILRVGLKTTDWQNSCHVQCPYILSSAKPKMGALYVPPCILIKLHYWLN